MKNIKMKNKKMKLAAMALVMLNLGACGGASSEQQEEIKKQDASLIDQRQVDESQVDGLWIMLTSKVDLLERTGDDGSYYEQIATTYERESYVVDRAGSTLSITDCATRTQYDYTMHGDASFEVLGGDVFFKNNNAMTVSMADLTEFKTPNFSVNSSESYDLSNVHYQASLSSNREVEAYKMKNSTAAIIGGVQYGVTNTDISCMHYVNQRVQFSGNDGDSGVYTDEHMSLSGNGEYWVVNKQEVVSGEYRNKLAGETATIVSHMGSENFIVTGNDLNVFVQENDLLNYRIEFTVIEAPSRTDGVISLHWL